MPQTLRQVVAERVGLLRRRRGWAQQELATRTKMGITTLNRVEKAHSSMSIDKLVALAKELGCSTDYLLGLSDNPGKRITSKPISEAPESELFPATVA